MKAHLIAIALSALAGFAVFAEEPKAGSVAASGNLIMHVFHSVDDPPKALVVELTDDYGFMIFNGGTEEKPKLLIMTGSRKEKKLAEARTWEDAEKLLEKIPAGSKVHYYGKCLMPTYYGLPESTWKRWEALLKKHKLIYAEEEDRITCTCREGG
ncbi:hypothetical protein [Luteolibacter soli]|uniref:Uncharacterized protein n=1 Tax=Luteolibacter soli TaxID=3135280 RepID=A0ABU9AV38_9BACT